MSRQFDLEQFRKEARAHLREKRYQHTLAVARLSTELAEAHGADPEKAEAAGLLHDITKQENVDVQLQMLRDSAIIMDTVQLGNPNVYHAVTGYLYARDKLGVTDPDVLNAIRYHTTGRAGMSLLEKIVYTADAAAYDRTYPDAQRLRELAFTDLESCMFEIIEFTIEGLIRKRALIAPDTLACYNALCLERGNRYEKEEESIDKR